MRKSVPIKPSVQPGHRWPHTVTAVERVEGWRLALADLAVVLEAQKGGPHTGDLPGPPPLHPINAAQSFWPCLAKIVPKMPGEHCTFTMFTIYNLQCTAHFTFEICGSCWHFACFLAKITRMKVKTVSNFFWGGLSGCLGTWSPSARSGDKAPPGVVNKESDIATALFRKAAARTTVRGGGGGVGRVGLALGSLLLNGGSEFGDHPQPFL